MFLIIYRSVMTDNSRNIKPISAVRLYKNRSRERDLTGFVEERRKPRDLFRHRSHQTYGRPLAVRACYTVKLFSIYY